MRRRGICDSNYCKIILFKFPIPLKLSGRTIRSNGLSSDLAFVCLGGLGDAGVRARVDIYSTFPLPAVRSVTSAH